MSRWFSGLLAAAAFVSGTLLSSLDLFEDSSTRTGTSGSNGSGSVTNAATLTFADITALDVLAAAHTPAAPFWRTDKELLLQRFERIRMAEADARRALTELFGSKIADVPALWRLFRPLHDRMPQLGSAEQIAIRSIEQAYTASATASDSPIDFDELLRRIDEALGADIAREYALHMSPLANELREAQFELSESEFRASYAVLNRLSEAQTSGEFLDARNALRNVLGDRRSARFWARRDPRYTSFAATAEHYALDQEKTLTAWQIVLEDQDAMLGLIADGPGEHQPARIRSQYDQTRRRLEALVGERAADALMQVATPDTRK
jgi:hypothetical protein